ncbi:hypothetical protein LP7551_02406 [Roseibium album]|nr:hypothetical protein LP7551_02406 [Roseibium album]
MQSLTAVDALLDVLDGADLSDVAIYCDSTKARDLSRDWFHALDTLFADNDFYDRPVKKAHGIVWKAIRDFYDEPTVQYLYAPAKRVLSRLQVHGYSRNKCIAIWETEFQSSVSYGEENNQRNDGELEEHLSFLKGLTFDDWAKWERANKSSRCPHWGSLRLLTFSDPYVELAIQIEVHGSKAVWADLSGIYSDEFDPALSLHENLSRAPADLGLNVVEPVGNVLILTEGPSDTRILSAAIAAMYPEFSDIFSFVDFKEFKVDGGASPLTKTVRAFAGARMMQRILALFDNDAAGHEQKQLLDRTKLPANIKAMVLPDLPFARRYPTIGPEGLRDLDINGTACAIEMFLGQTALSDEHGELRPVRWANWNKNAGRYHGGLEDKGAVARHFLEAVSASSAPSQLKRRFKDMDRLLKTIFCAFDPV